MMLRNTLGHLAKFSGPLSVLKNIGRAHLFQASVVHERMLAVWVTHAQLHQRPHRCSRPRADWTPIQQPHQRLHTPLRYDRPLRSPHAKLSSILLMIFKYSRCAHFGCVGEGRIPLCMHGTPVSYQSVASCLPKYQSVASCLPNLPLHSFAVTSATSEAAKTSRIREKCCIGKAAESQAAA